MQILIPVTTLFLRKQRTTEWGETIVSDAEGTITIQLPNYPFALYDETYILSIQADDVLYIWNDKTEYLWKIFTSTAHCGL